MTEVDALGAWTPTEEEGIKEQELWSLYATLTDYILPRIQAFRSMKRTGYPVFDDDFNDYEYCENGREEEDRNMAEWENILFDIEEAFTTMKNTEHFERSAAQNQTIKRGLLLFATHYEKLWD